MIWLGFRLFLYVQLISSGTKEYITARSDGIDGFLPISGLMGTVSWVKEGGINFVHPAAVVIFLTVILVSLLLRRSFCSWICPIATLSEVVWKSGFRLLLTNRRFPAWLDNSLRSLKYITLLIFIYSIGFAMTSEALLAFIQSDYHKLADVRLLNFFLHISSLAMIIVIALVALSFLLRNPFCRYLCPYGALLGLVATLSPLRVTRNTERCVSCGVCSQACPSNIDVMHKTSVYSPECIACWRCISYCRITGALSMRAFRRLNVPGIVFAVLVVLLFLAGTFIGKITGHWHSAISLEDYVRLLGN
jgi:polyferredoxin